MAARLAPTRIEGEVQRIRALIAARSFGAAADACRALLGEVPENRDVLYLSAVSERYSGRVADALRTLERLEAAHGPSGRLYQERGHCYRHVSEPAAAQAAYRCAVVLNPTLHASWRVLETATPAPPEGATEPADLAHARAMRRRLAALSGPLQGAYDCFYEADWVGTERALARCLAADPRDVEALRLRALLAAKLDALEEAQSLLERALELAPADEQLHAELVGVLLRLHDFERALGKIRVLRKLDPANRDYRASEAFACLSLGRAQEALSLYRGLAREQPARADWASAVGYCSQVLGRPVEAVDAYRLALRLRPGWGEPYWSLANLKTYRFTDAEVAAMRSRLAAAEPRAADAVALHFALGKALEDRGEFAESFRCYRQGNALKRSQVRFAIDEVERNAGEQRRLCTASFFAARRDFGSSEAAPIFIVGMPRSGSTLIEQILASHSSVEGTRELAHITRLANRLALAPRCEGEGRYPAVLGQLDAAEARRLGAWYLEETRPYRRGAARFIDKMPGNFRHLGLIRLILPNARIIDARRDPMACCFSNFKQLFAEGHEFSYDFEDLARYHRSYVELMAHWQSVLPGWILRVDHEELVTDLQGGVRRLLDFCGLDFEPSCLEFHRTARAVYTASSEQVRQPVSADMLRHWRHFEPWLGALAEALGEAEARDDARDDARGDAQSTRHEALNMSSAVRPGAGSK